MQNTAYQTLTWALPGGSRRCPGGSAGSRESNDLQYRKSVTETPINIQNRDNRRWVVVNDRGRHGG
jgi:hypothetical protein